MQGKLQGTEVNLCMQLVHYVVMQGLGVTRDWNASAHENAHFVSSVHLRNMSHISLGCLSLLLHTCVDKALVPVNSCLIHMPVPSPVLNSKSPAAIEYDPRLHVDTHTASVDGCSDNMLSVSARFPTTSNWVLLELARNEHILLYKNIANVWPEMRNARYRQDLFPFPPESVAHMAHVFSQVQGISQRWAKEIGDARTSRQDATRQDVRQDARQDAWQDTQQDAQQDVTAHERADDSCALRYHNDLFPAMLLLGASAGPDQVAHEQCMLTLSSMQDRRELACMSWEHGLLFSAHIEGRRVVLQETVPTHEWPDTAKISNSTVRPFAAMPLPD
jgi:hypothetical protein